MCAGGGAVGVQSLIYVDTRYCFRLCMTQLILSAQLYHRILKLARTIADLAEALQYRPKIIMR